jgi:hypothetical protein
MKRNRGLKECRYPCMFPHLFCIPAHVNRRDVSFVRWHGMCTSAPRGEALVRVIISSPRNGETKRISIPSPSHGLPSRPLKGRDRPIDMGGQRIIGANCLRSLPVATACGVCPCSSYVQSKTAERLACYTLNRARGSVLVSCSQHNPRRGKGGRPCRGWSDGNS